MDNVSWNIDADKDCMRFVSAPLKGIWMNAWLQAKTRSGFWVQFDPEGLFRWVTEIKELST